MYKYTWLWMNLWRLLIIGLFTLLVGSLFIFNAQQFPQLSFFQTLAGFNVLLFLFIGALAFLYADRRGFVSVLLFLFCGMMALIFATESGAIANNPLFSAFTASCSAVAVGILALLLVIFPHNGFQMRWVLGGRSYIVWVAVLSCLAILAEIPVYLYPWFPTAFDMFSSVCFLLLLIGVVWHLIVSYLRAMRTEKQQLRFFLAGLFLALGPLLVFTVLPSAFNLPTIPGQWTSLALAFLPITLAYGALRYQLLIADRQVSRFVVVCLCILFLMVEFVLLQAVGLLLSPSWPMFLQICIPLLLILLTWRFARFVTENWVLSELRYFRRDLHRFVESPSAIDNSNLDKVASALVPMVQYHFNTSQICLLVLDESADSYHVYPSFLAYPSLGSSSKDDECLNLLRFVCDSFSAPAPTRFDSHYALHKQTLSRLTFIKRPLLLSEALNIQEGIVRGPRRFLLASSPRREDQVLLAPIHMRGLMIGAILLGERRDHSGYAGPDQEKLQTLLDEFTPIIETARLYAQAAQHAHLLERLYEVNTLPVSSLQTIDDAASAYVQIAASACSCRADIWFLEDQALLWAYGAGKGLQATTKTYLSPLDEEDWLPCYWENCPPSPRSETSTPPACPTCLEQPAACTFAWLPLKTGTQRVGVLILSYERSHIFTKQEQRVLEMFASQCASALENARMTTKLRLAYERQKELDKLKDQFIITASHELRTPLTAVQGYIELLGEHNAALSAEMRETFIARARRGCDELTLMVGNIMDASHVPTAGEIVELKTLSAHEAVVYVLEILDGVISREQRALSLSISPDLFVLADDMRLHQILLNLLNNALKYSPPKTQISIAAHADHDFVVFHIRDYGLGVPPEDQKALFERFVRLERDLNSPVRGAGLGLFISRQLIEAMGGQIWVKSSGRPGEGSTFSFTLRRALQPSPLPSDLEHGVPGIPSQ